MSCESEVCNEAECIKPKQVSANTLVDLAVAQREQQIRNTNRLAMIEKKIDALLKVVVRMENKSNGFTD